MHRRTLLTAPLAIAATALAAAPAHAAGHGAVDAGGEGRTGYGARVLTVMTFNIHHAEGTDGVLDLGRIAEVIRASGADVIGLQEVDRHFSERSGWADQPAELAEVLGFHAVFGANIDQEPPASGAPRVQYGTAVLSRHPITDWENVHLAGSPGQEQRGLLRAAVDVDGRSVAFFCTHLAASSQADRLEQVQQIVELVGPRDPAVVVGDVNARPDAPEVRALADAFTDAWSAAGHGDGSSYPAGAPESRIDDIFVTGSVRPVRTTVLHGVPEASDHLPVVSRVVVKP